MKLIRFVLLIALANLSVEFASASEYPESSQNKIGIRRFPDIESRISFNHRLQARGPGGEFGTSRISVYSALTPIDLYQIQDGNFRIGVLSPVVFGIGTFIPFLISFPSIEGFQFIKKSYWAFLLPGYLLNPEMKLRLIGGAQIYSGYSFNLVHEKRIRPIYSANGGIELGISKSYPKLRLGYERIIYRSQILDCPQVGLSLEI
jgi:hypothetical protein